MEEWEGDAAEALDRVTRGPMADAFTGTARILALTPPERRGRYQTCTMQLELRAPGLAAEELTTEVVLDRRFWPEPGALLRARISRTTPRMLEVDWDSLAR